MPRNNVSSARSTRMAPGGMAPRGTHTSRLGHYVDPVGGTGYEVVGELATSGKVTLDANGNGIVELGPHGAHQRWEVEETIVTSNQPASSTPVPSAEVFCPFVSPTFSKGKTNSGNNDVFAGRLSVGVGDNMQVQFLGGVPGAIQYVRVNGLFYTQVG